MCRASPRTREFRAKHDYRGDDATGRERYAQALTQSAAARHETALSARTNALQSPKHAGDQIAFCRLPKTRAFYYVCDYRTADCTLCGVNPFAFRLNTSTIYTNNKKRH